MKRANMRRRFAKLTHNVKKTFRALRDLSPISLSVIAVMAITWYLATSYDVTNAWWFLPLFAIVTGALAIILPILCERFKIVNSIISTGFAIFLLEILTSFITCSLLTVFSTLSIIAFITELLVDNLMNEYGVGNIIFDAAICMIASLIIVNLNSSLAEIIVILICYVVVLVSNFKITLSLRRFKTRTDNKPTDISTTDTIQE